MAASILEILRFDKIFFFMKSYISGSIADVLSTETMEYSDSNFVAYKKHVK